MCAPGVPEPRITLTASVLLNARAIYIQIEGAAKRMALAKALEAGPVEEMPIRAVLRHAGERLEIFYCP